MNLDQYFAVSGSRFSNRDAQILGPWLKSLGNVDAEEMWADARSEASPAHPYIEWDVEKAAKAHQVEQCRVIGRSIRAKVVGVSGAEHNIPAFVAVPVKLDTPDEATPDAPGSRLRLYTHFRLVQEDKDKSLWVRQDALKALLGWKRRYEAYVDVYPDFGATFQLVFDAIEGAEAHLELAAG